MTAWHASLFAKVGSFVLDVALEGRAGPVALVGPNGSGKTTTLRALSGAIEVERAHVVVGDDVLEHTTAGVRLPIETRRIGYVPQGYGLFPHLSVLDNVAFGLSTGLHRLPLAARRERAAQMLGELDCADLAPRRVGRLSGGEQQRVALARALVLDPALLLLDEPLAALDASRRRAVRSFLAEKLADFGRPSILVTHDPRDVAALDAAVVVLDGGRVVQTGTLAALREAPATPFVAEFANAAA